MTEPSNLGRVAVLAAGGVGGYYGGRLAAAGVDVHFIARGRHLDALRRDGLRVRSTLGDFEVPVSATDVSSTIGPCDVVLFCVKTYDTDAALPLLAPLVGADTAVLSLQNGVDSEEKIAAAIGAEHVIGGAAYIFSIVREPGLIEHSAGPASIAAGELDGRGSARVDRFVDAARAAGITVTASARIREVLWSKFAFICAVAGTTAAVRLPIGEIRSASASRELARQLADEVATVGRTEGVGLPDTLPDDVLRLMDAQEPGMFSSMYEDLVSGRRMELEAMHGEVLRRASRAGIPVPATAAIYGVLQPWAQRAG